MEKEKEGVFFIRNFPVRLRWKLKEKAASQGKTLQEFCREVLERAVAEESPKRR